MASTPTCVRLALLLLTLTGGVGVVLYMVGFALSRPPDELPRATASRARLVSATVDRCRCARPVDC